MILVELDNQGSKVTAEQFRDRSEINRFSIDDVRKVEAVEFSWRAGKKGDDVGESGCEGLDVEMIELEGAETGRRGRFAEDPFDWIEPDRGERRKYSLSEGSKDVANANLIPRFVLLESFSENDGS